MSITRHIDRFRKDLFVSAPNRQRRFLDAPGADHISRFVGCWNGRNSSGRCRSWTFGRRDILKFSGRETSVPRHCSNRGLHILNWFLVVRLGTAGFNAK